MNLELMQAGKERADAERRELWAEQQAAYMDWIREEHRTHVAKVAAEELHGHDSEQYIDAYATWSDVLKSMPTPPPDHGWSR